MPEGRVSYTMSLYRFGADEATLVTILEEHDQYWVGRRIRMGAGDTKVENFAKGEWSREPAKATEAKPRRLPNLPYSLVRLP